MKRDEDLRMERQTQWQAALSMLCRTAQEEAYTTHCIKFHLPTQPSDTKKSESEIMGQNAIWTVDWTTDLP